MASKAGRDALAGDGDESTRKLKSKVESSAEPLAARSSAVDLQLKQTVVDTNSFSTQSTDMDDTDEKRSIVMGDLGTAATQAAAPPNDTTRETSISSNDVTSGGSSASTSGPDAATPVVSPDIFEVAKHAIFSIWSSTTL